MGGQAEQDVRAATMRAVKDEVEEEDGDTGDDDEEGEEEEEEEVQEAEEELDIDEQLAKVQEDYNQPEEDEGKKDIFDLDENENSANTTAVSSIKPPRPPPPTNFPKRQDYHEASGGAGRQGGGGRHGGGRGGRHGDSGRHGGRERYGGGGRHNRKNSGGGQSYGGWGNCLYQHENLVAEMKLGASGHADASLRLKCPPFEEPSQLACYSRASDGSVHWDDRCLRRFRSGILSEAGADLNEGYESYVEKREDTDGSGSAFGDLLACLRAQRIAVDNIHFVTFRNNLNKILGTAYNRQYPWEMGVYKRFGTIYLDVRKLPEGPQSEQQRRSCYWGYSFERVATENRSGPRSEMSRLNGAAKKGALDNVVVDANVEFCAVLRTKLGPHRIIMGAEMDCYEPGRDDKKSYIELKTSRELEPRTVDKFEREKLLKFWIQSFLAGVPRIVCGFRDDGGRIVQSEMMTTKDITNRVKQKHFWEGDVCLAFADQVLCWLYGSVKENEDYLLRFIPAANRLELLRESSCPEIITKHLEDKPQYVEVDEVFYAQQQKRQREADAEERAKREREAILAKADEGRSGRFVPSRKRHEDPVRTDSTPPTEERNPVSFRSSRVSSAREDGEKWQRPAEREPEQPTGPSEAAAPGKYQPPVRREGRYEPPVRRTIESYSSDAPPPRTTGGRFSDRYAEADAEERAKREREAILAKADEGRTGRFVPSRKRHEDPVRTDSAPPTEGRNPVSFSSSRVSSAREDGDKWQRPAEREPEQPTGPTEAAAPAAPGKYQPPVRRGGRYEPPVRRTSESYSSDAPPPRTTGGRVSDRYADRDREPQRPAPFSGDRSERGVEDRWSRGGATRPNVRGGSERSERPPLFGGANKDEGDSWRRSTNPDGGRPKPAEDSAA